MKKKIMFAALVAFLIISELNYVRIPPAKASISIALNPIEAADVDGEDYNYSLLHSGGSANMEVWNSTFIENGQFVDGGLYYISRTFLKFDTTSIPQGAIVQNVRLGLKVSNAPTPIVDFQEKIRNWTGNSPIGLEDFTAFGDTSYDDGSFNASGKAVDSWYNITISNVGIISVGGYTQIAILSERDILGIQPSSNEWIDYYSEDSAGNEPILYISYIADFNLSVESNIPVITFYINGTIHSTPYYDFIDYGYVNATAASQYYENSTGSWEFSSWLVNGTATYTTREIDLSITGNTTLYMTYTPIAFNEPLNDNKLLAAYTIPSNIASIGALNITTMNEKFNLTTTDVGYWATGVTYGNYTYLGSISDGNITKVDNTVFTITNTLYLGKALNARDMVIASTPYAGGEALFVSTDRTPAEIYVIALSNFTVMYDLILMSGTTDAYSLASDGTSLYVGTMLNGSSPAYMYIVRVNYNNFANQTYMAYTSNDPDATGMWDLTVDSDGWLYASIGTAIVKTNTTLGTGAGTPPPFGVEVARLGGFPYDVSELYAQQNYMLFAGSENSSATMPDVMRIGLHSFTIVQNITMANPDRETVSGLYALNDTLFIGFGYSDAVVWKYNYVTATEIAGVRMGGNSSGSTTLTFVLPATVSAARISGFEIPGIEGDWLIREKKFYNFVLTLRGIDDTALIKFFDGANNNITFGYRFTNSSTVILNGSDYIILHTYPPITYNPLDTDEFNLTLQVMIRITMIDKLNVTFYGWANTTSGYETGWQTLASNYCNIYSKGGIQLEYDTSGYAGRISGGDIFDFYAGNLSTVHASSVFLNLQHVKMLPTFKIENTLSTYAVFTISYVFSVKFEGEKTWTQEIKVTMTDIIFASGTGQWLVWNTTWYDYQNKEFYALNISAYQPTKSGDTQPSTVPMWVDLWVNRQNESSVMGARVGAYYYPMTDSSHDWLRWLTGSNWGIEDQLTPKGIAFTTIRDSNGVVKYAKNIELAKLDVTLTQLTVTAGFTAFATDYNVFDLTFGEHEYEGIQTPPFEETRTPVIAAGGFLGSIWGAISWLGSILGPVFATAAFKMWSYFSGFLDTLFGWFGLPGFFSSFISWLVTGFSWLSTSILYLVNILAAFFIFIALFIWKLLNWVATTFIYIGQMITVFFNFLGGAYTAGINVWNDFGIANWIILGIILYPIYLVFVWEEEGFDAVLSQLSFIYNVFMTGLGFLMSLVHYIASGINYIIEAIPVVE